MKEKIRKAVLEMGADVCGFADVNDFSEARTGFRPDDVFKKCRSVIVFGIALPKGCFEINSRIIYGHYNSLTVPMVDNIAFKTARYIEDNLGGIAVPLPSDGPYDYWDAEKLEGRGTISMKHAAVNAGLGSIGKNTLLVNPTYGNRLTIGAVLTDIEIQKDKKTEELCLKNCHLCIENCPVSAINSNKTVTQRKCRPNSYGKTTRGFDTVECNKCRVICPLKYGIKTD